MGQDLFQYPAHEHRRNPFVTFRLMDDYYCVCLSCQDEKKDIYLVDL